MAEESYWQGLARRRASRRGVLRAAALGAAGLVAAAGFGCSGGGSKPSGGGTAGQQASGGSEANGKPGGTLVLAHSGNPPNYDIVSSTSYITSGFISVVYNGLLTFRNGTAAYPEIVDNTLVPDLAAAMPEQPDNQTYIFKIRPDVKWQNKPPLNGRALTAEDVKGHYERAIGATELTSALKTDFGIIDTIETPDAQTVKMTLKAPYAAFLVMVVGGFNRYVEPPELADGGKLKTTLIGTGPFTLENHEQNVRGVFKKNPTYFKKDAAGTALPYADEFQWLSIIDSGARLQALQSRQANLSWVLSPDELDQLKATNSNDFTFVEGPGISSYIYMRLDKPPFNDKRVRQAMSLSIDRKGEIQAIGKGHGDVDLPVPIFLKDWALTPDKMGDAGKFYNRDIATAKQLMAAAGYGGGIKTTMSYTAEYGAAFVQGLQLTQGYLKEIGIDAELKQIEYAPYLSTVFKGDFEGLAYGPRGIFPDVDPYIGYFYTPGSIYYQDHSDDKQLQGMIQQQRQALDVTARKKIVNDIQIYLSDQQYRVYGAAVARNFAWGKNVRNYRANEWFPYSNVETTWIAT